MNEAAYQYRRGSNLLRVFEETGQVGLADVQEPLQKCLELEPDFADCHFLLGEVASWSDDDELAGPAPLAYELAAAYAKTEPPLNSQVKEKVVTFMKRFYEGACRGDSAINYKEECFRASVWVASSAP